MSYWKHFIFVSEMKSTQSGHPILGDRPVVSDDEMDLIADVVDGRDQLCVGGGVTM